AAPLDTSPYQPPPAQAAAPAAAPATTPATTPAAFLSRKLCDVEQIFNKRTFRENFFHSSTSV
ncbi:MAG TPA: hypothetical protein H9898_02540, partial [Candidatus Anaerobiospirillum stercoravium]|nr:hypothetical protein [Candidatus Anaerobiospirillum stercoravium]